MTARCRLNATQARGFTLIEFMIAITLSIVVLAALSAAFVSGSRARSEIERVNQQIENGRYALEVLTNDIELAGFWGKFHIQNALVLDTIPLPTPAEKPDPCVSAVANIAAFAADDEANKNTLNYGLPMHIQGYDGGTNLGCLPDDVRAGTDIVVVRRVSTCAVGEAGCGTLAGAPYFQAALCENQLQQTTFVEHYRLEDSAGWNRQNRTCDGPAERRRFYTHIYFIANNDTFFGDGDPRNDGIPTLKRAELDGNPTGSTCPAENRIGDFCIVSVAQGIEDFQVEYGIDTDGDGIVNAYTASPDQFDRAAADLNDANPHANCAGNPDCTTDWWDVMAVKVYLLARNLTPSPDFNDTRTYVLGLDAGYDPVERTPCTPSDACAFPNTFKRHAFQSTVRIKNPSGRRES